MLYGRAMLSPLFFLFRRPFYPPSRKTFSPLFGVPPALPAPLTLLFPWFVFLTANGLPGSTWICFLIDFLNVPLYFFPPSKFLPFDCSRFLNPRVSSPPFPLQPVLLPVPLDSLLLEETHPPLLLCCVLVALGSPMLSIIQVRWSLFFLYGNVLSFFPLFGFLRVVSPHRFSFVSSPPPPL